MLLVIHLLGSGFGDLAGVAVALGTVPEPGSGALMIGGLALADVALRRRALRFA